MMQYRGELLSYARTPSLQVTDASMLLIALAPYPHVEIELSYLANKIRGKNIRWAKTNKLSTVTLRLLALGTHNESEITGSLLAILASRLIKAETNVGGPYHTTNDDDIMLNALIAQLFELLGSPLVSLNDYLHNAIKAKPEYLSTSLGIWSIRRPTKLELNLEVPNDNIAPSSLKQRVAAISLNTTKRFIESEPYYESGETTIEYIRSEINTMPPDIKPIALRLWKKVVDIDHRYEITCLSRVFAYSIKDSVTSLSDSDLRDLGVANFYAWIAYTIYDDLIDDEGDAALLPVANIFHRLSLFRYLKFASQEFVEMFYDYVDLANFYELSNYRASISDGFIDLPSPLKYGDPTFLAQRSRGHVLGPLLIASRVNSGSTSQQELVRRALDDYLIARQLNDDSHDWVKDLENGQLSFVVLHLLAKTHTKPGRHQLKELTQVLRTYFWKQGLDEIGRLTIMHATQAKDYLKKSRLVHTDSAFVKNFIDPIGESARDASRQLSEQKKFIHMYRRRSP